MNKKINIGAKPSNNKSADEWVSSRQTPTDQPSSIKRLTIDITADLHAQIKMQCAKEGVKMVDAIRAILHERFGGPSR